MPVYSQRVGRAMYRHDAFRSSIVGMDVMRMRHQVDRRHSTARTIKDYVGVGADTATVGSMAFGPVAFGAVSACATLVKTLSNVFYDEAAYEREKAQQFEKFIAEHAPDKDPIVMQAFLEDCLTGLGPAKDCHTQAQIELTKNLGELLISEWDDLGVQLQKIEDFLAADASEKSLKRKQAEIQQKYQSYVDGFSLLAKIGHEFEIPNLEKVGQIGVVAVDMHNELSGLASVLTRCKDDRAGLLDLLSPASAVCTGIFALLALVGEQPESESQVIMSMLENIQAIMTEYHRQIYDKLSDIHADIAGLSCQMMYQYQGILYELALGEERLHKLIEYRFNRLGQKHDEHDRRQTEIGKRVLSHELAVKMHAVQTADSGFAKGLSSDAFYEYASTFSYWMIDAARHEVHNGALQAKTTSDTTRLIMDHLQPEHDPYQQMALLLHCINNQVGLLRNNFESFDTVVVNPYLWMMATDAYLTLAENASHLYQRNAAVSEAAIKTGENYVQAIDRLRYSKEIYEFLFQAYIDVVKEYKDLVEHEKIRLIEDLDIDVFVSDFQQALADYNQTCELPAEVKIIDEAMRKELNQPTLPLQNFAAQIQQALPKEVVAAVNQGLGELQISLQSVMDGKSGCYLDHIKDVPVIDIMMQKEKDVFEYEVEGYGNVDEYEYLEKQFQFNIAFKQIGGEILNLGEITLGTLLTMSFPEDRMCQALVQHLGIDQALLEGRHTPNKILTLLNERYDKDSEVAQKKKSTVIKVDAGVSGYSEIIKGNQVVANLRGLSAARLLFLLKDAQERFAAHWLCSRISNHEVAFNASALDEVEETLECSLVGRQQTLLDCLNNVGTEQGKKMADIIDRIQALDILFAKTLKAAGFDINNEQVAVVRNSMFSATDAVKSAQASTTQFFKLDAVVIDGASDKLQDLQDAMSMQSREPRDFVQVDVERIEPGTIAIQELMRSRIGLLKN